MRVAERHGVQPGNVELVPVAKHAAADERHVEVTRARAVGVEGQIIGPACAGDGAPAKNYRGVRRGHALEGGDESRVASGVAIESEVNDASERCRARFGG